jgi:hypothetical protein
MGGQVVIGVFHDHAQQGMMRKTLLVFGPQSHVTHDVIE